MKSQNKHIAFDDNFKKYNIQIINEDIVDILHIYLSIHILHHYNINKMNKFIEAVKEIDMYSHNQFLRYRQEDSYRTFLGGCTTISLIIIFIGIFFTMITDTLARNIISGSTIKSFQTTPQHSTIEINAEKNFMLAFGIVGLNMNDYKRYFDVTFEQVGWSKQSFKNQAYLQFGPCIKQQWLKMSQSIGQSYDNLGLNTFYCLKQGQKIQLGGRWSIQDLQMLQINVIKCSNNSQLYPNTTCATQDQIKQFIKDNGSLIAKIYFINTNINLQSKDYLNPYIQEKNWIHFDLNLGAYSQIYLSEYHIKTDQSLFPWSSVYTDDGLFMDSMFAQYMQRIGITNDTYFRMSLLKSEFRYDSTRSFQKIDATLSFIGGLYGAFLIIFRFLSFYSKYAYEIEFGDRIFRKNDKSSYGSEHFGFLKFIGYSLFNILSNFGINLRWKEMRQYHECRLQSLKQLDINLMFKKIEFFQKISSITMEDHHLSGLHLFPKNTIEQSKKVRRSHLLQGIIYNQLNKKSRDINIQQQQKQDKFSKIMSQPKYQQYFHQSYLQKQNQQNLQNFNANSLKKLNISSIQGDAISKKILGKIKIGNEEIFSMIIRCFEMIEKENPKQNQNQQIISEEIIVNSSTNLSRVGQYMQ